MLNLYINHVILSSDSKLEGFQILDLMLSLTKYSTNDITMNLVEN
jgi:hypothetical protein